MAMSFSSRPCRSDTLEDSHHLALLPRALVSEDSVVGFMSLFLQVCVSVLGTAWV